MENIRYERIGGSTPYVTTNKDHIEGTVPDGVGRYYEKGRWGLPVWKIEYHEVKATKNQIKLSSFQVKKELLSLANQIAYKAKAYRLVTTSDVTFDDKKSVVRCANENSIYFSHLISKFKMDSDGTIWLNFFLDYTNDYGNQIQLPANGIQLPNMKK